MISYIVKTVTQNVLFPELDVREIRPEAGEKGCGCADSTRNEMPGEIESIGAYFQKEPLILWRNGR